MPARSELTIDYAIALLDELDGRELQSTGWSPSVVFQHCGQSILCSMNGYPEHKAAWFKSTIGPLAFQLFRMRGAMRHDTAQDIPGLTVDDPTVATAHAIADLKQTYRAFAEYDGPLQDHFAYGRLTKRDYEIAHVLHLLNHLEEIRRVG